MTDETSTGNELAVEMCGVTKRYRDSLALDGLDLCIRRGTTFGLLGPNGAGKSTAIRALMGLTSFDEGTVAVLGQDVRNRTGQQRQRIGYVPELHHMYRWMTVAEILEFVSSLYNNWDKSVASELLDSFELPDKKKVKHLSKGMVAKLGLTIALAHHPELLVLDEPTSGLDPIIREDFLESILRANIAGGRTVLFSSHHVDDVERIADDVGIMIAGKIVLRATVDEIRSQVKRLRIVLSDGKLPSHPPAEMLWQRLSRREWSVTVYPFSPQIVQQISQSNAVEHVDVLELSLEEIFKDVARGRRATTAELQEC